VLKGSGSSEYILCEIKTSRPIKYIAWDDGDLLIVTDQHFAKALNKGFHNEAKRNRYCQVNADILNEISDVPEDFAAMTFKAGFPHFALLENGQILEFDGVDWNHIKSVDGDFTFLPTIGSVATPLILQNNSDSLVVWGAYSEYVVHLSSNGAHTYHLNSTNAAITESSFCDQACEWVPIGKTLNGFYLAPDTIRSVRTAVKVPIVEIECENQCSVISVEYMRMDVPNNHEFRFIASLGTRSFYAVSAYTEIGNAQSWQLYRLREQKAPEIVVSSQFLQHSASEAGLVYYERLYQSLFRWAIATDNRVLINYVGGDPVFRVNLANKSVENIFTQSDLFSYNQDTGLLALSNRGFGEEDAAYSVMIVRDIDKGAMSD